jgi:hypothetical protein
MEDVSRYAGMEDGGCEQVCWCGWIKLTSCTWNLIFTPACLLTFSIICISIPGHVLHHLHQPCQHTSSHPSSTSAMSEYLLISSIIHVSIPPCLLLTGYLYKINELLFLFNTLYCTLGFNLAPKPHFEPFFKLYLLVLVVLWALNGQNDSKTGQKGQFWPNLRTFWKLSHFCHSAPKLVTCNKVWISDRTEGLWPVTSGLNPSIQYTLSVYSRKYKKVWKMTVHSCTSSQHLRRSQRLHSSLKYCTAIFNSVLGVTCDQPKVLADRTFSSVLLPRREEILIFNHFVTSQGLWRTAMWCRALGQISAWCRGLWPVTAKLNITVQ